MGSYAWYTGAQEQGGPCSIPRTCLLRGAPLTARCRAMPRSWSCARSRLPVSRRGLLEVGFATRLWARPVTISTSVAAVRGGRARRLCEARGISVIESGIKFGGITAVVGGERIEVTAYRLDGFYTDGRHPEDVQRASCVEDDLARRDFTVNAMAWHPERGLLDRYDGRGDLERRQIRAVGEPRRRFEEDALRMLRAVRFACRLDFSMDAATAMALASCAPLLDQVARERVGIELEGILVTRRGGDALVRYPEVMCAAIPELAAARGFDQHTKYHAFDVYEHVARVLTVAGELSSFRIDGGDPIPPSQRRSCGRLCCTTSPNPRRLPLTTGGVDIFTATRSVARSWQRRLCGASHAATI